MKMIRMVMAAGAVAVLAGSAFAMGDELEPLRRAVTQDMEAIGAVVGDVSQLTLAQLGEIKAVFDSDMTPGDQKEEIAVIFEQHGNGSRITSLADFDGLDQLQRAVASDLDAAGIQYDHPERLTLAQLAELKDIFDSSDAGQQSERAKAVLARMN